MKDPVSVIDLGTNTFHIIIAQADGKLFKEIFRNRIFVNLAEDGIEKISDDAANRALEAIRFFHSQLLKYKVKKVKVFGTAALRTATNGASILDKIYRQTGLAVEIIDGDREADLIFKGTSLVVPMESQNVLIMDIGGGSVEFIVCNHGAVIWKGSFSVGVTVLQHRFRHSDPIRLDEIEEIKQYLQGELLTLQTILSKYRVHSLVGASGSFEVMQKMLSGRLYKTRAIHYSINQFKKIYNILIPSTLEERLSMPRLIKDRAKLVVVAFVLIRYVIEMAEVKDIIVSPYALKEGALSELT